MPEDLTTAEPADESFEEGEFEWDETTSVEYVTMGINVYATLQEIDIQILKPQEKLRIEQMRRWSLRIAHTNLKDIYDLLYSEPVEEPPVN